VGVTCQYCEQPAKQVHGDVIYPYNDNKELHEKKFWYCEPCDAYVGCHPSGKPLGLLANFDLRTARIKAHYAFDRLWRCGGMTRDEAYSWLSDALVLDSRSCHIAKMDEAECKEVVRVCKEKS